MRNFKKITLILFLVFSLLPTEKSFAQNTNTGFVSGNIWYSKDPFEEGDKIKIYTFIFNPDKRELSGSVVFFNKTVLLGKKDFTISGNRAQDVSIDWTVTAGDHTIFGKIENAKYLISKGKYEEIFIAENQTEKSNRTVSKKITTKTNNSDTDSSSFDPTITNIKNIIEEKTPDAIAKPVASVVNVLETFRENTGINSLNKKEELQNELKSLDAEKPSLEKDISVKKYIQKPFKYVEIFFLTLFSYILNNKILFYGILVALIFIILRFVWNKIL